MYSMTIATMTTLWYYSNHYLPMLLGCEAYAVKRPLWSCFLIKLGKSASSEDRLRLVTVGYVFSGVCYCIYNQIAQLEGDIPILFIGLPVKLVNQCFIVSCIPFYECAVEICSFPHVFTRKNTWNETQWKIAFKLLDSIEDSCVNLPTKLFWQFL